MSPDMQAAVDAFKLDPPHGCKTLPQYDKPIYTLITVEGWPRAVHYEFRDRAGSPLLYVELHIEDPAYLFVKEVMQLIERETPVIENFPLQYFESRPWPNFKKWPSLSIAVPKGGDGRVAATVMRSFINGTRAPIASALALQELE